VPCRQASSDINLPIKGVAMSREFFDTQGEGLAFIRGLQKGPFNAKDPQKAPNGLWVVEYWPTR